jgi:hypothetical protein
MWQPIEDVVETCRAENLEKAKQDIPACMGSAAV